MSVELAIRIRAIDEATESIRKVGEEVKKTAEAVENGNKSISRSTEEASEAQRRLSKAAAETDASFRDLVKGFSGAATAALALYQGYDRLQQMQYSISRANYQVQVAIAAVEEAQRRYNAAVERYGPASEQAASAARDLQLAQERYSLAMERAQILQGNYSQAVMSFALSVVPTTITAVDSLIKVKQNLSAASDLTSGAVKAFGAALNFLAANPIVLVAAAIAALILALKHLYDTNESFRNAVNALASALSNTLKPAIDLIINALTYLWNNVIKPVAEAFGWFVGVIAGAFQRLRGESEEAKVDVNQDFVEIRNQAVETGAQVRTSVQSAGSAVQGFASTVKASEATASTAFQGISSSAKQMAEEVYKGYTKVAEGVWVATDALKRAAIESAKAIGKVWDEYEARKERAMREAAAITGGVPLPEIPAFTPIVPEAPTPTPAPTEAPAPTPVPPPPKSVWEQLTPEQRAAQIALETAIREGTYVPHYTIPKRSMILPEGYQWSPTWARAGGDVGISWPETLQMGSQAWIDYMVRTGYFVRARWGFEGLVRRPTLFLAGEAGAEYVSIRPEGRGAVGPINITVNVAGSADERVIGQAVREIERALRSVVFEKTSRGAPDWSRRIRLGGGI